MLRVVLFVLVSLASLGCQSQNEDSAELASLQKQVAALTRQLEETRAHVEMLEQQGRQVSTALQNVEAEMERVSESASSPVPGNTAANVVAETTAQPPRSPAPSGDDPAAPLEPVEPEPPLSLKTQVACKEVWALFGQGASSERIATVLGATPEAIERCEQKIGRRSGEG